MSLLTDLISICTELRSAKPAARNKAAEQLDVILSSSQADLLTLFRTRATDAGGVTYAALFNSAVEATIKHAAKLEELQGSKSLPTMRNKNYLFRSIVGKLVDLNLEEDTKFIPHAVLFSAFVDGIEDHNAVVHFSPVFLNILERGIYKSPRNVQDLKVNEYSRILSYLFQIRLERISGLMARLDVLRVTNATIELAVEHVQINEDLITYLPQLLHYATNLKEECFRVEIVRMFYLYISQLSVDYHHTICTELQALLPVICRYYSFHMRVETKEVLFHAVYSLLHAIYPLINSGDTSTFSIDLQDNWTTTLHSLKSMIDVEIREQSQVNSRSQVALADKCLEYFVKMSALVTYLIYWQVEANNNNDDESSQTSRQKIVKPSDKLELIMQNVFVDKTRFNRFWLAIIAELTSQQENIINITNLHQLLQFALDILLSFCNENVLRYIRLCITASLASELQLYGEQRIATTASPCQAQWTKIVDFLIADSSTSGEVICEKQLLLQVLIRYGKLNHEQVMSLLNSYMANALMKRTECINTVREILIKSEMCGLDKTTEIVGRVLTWLNETQKLDARLVLHNIAPIEIGLIADTSAIAVINFLNEMQVFKATVARQQERVDSLPLLLYKYNRKYICLEEHGREMLCSTHSTRANAQCSDNKKNCLFQSNYELLMRLLNYETSQKTTCRDIACDLVLLLKMCALLDSLLQYDVLTLDNYMQCPLIKRIGFFLSHLEFQMKCNISAISKDTSLPYDTICEILQRLVVIFGIFVRNALLLQYIEAQPLDELIAFLSATLKYSATRQLRNDFENWSTVSHNCLQVLATLCASATHLNETFVCISEYRMNVKTDLPVLLKLIDIFCAQQLTHEHIANWFVDQLKMIFKLYYTHIETMQQVVELLPAVLIYVQQYDDMLQNMLTALHSLLKIALKRSYPVQLIAKLIDAIRYILRRCHSIFGQPNFTNICLSVTKFLCYPAFRIQFITVNVLCALLDVNWLPKSKRSPALHFEFCDKLYKYINLSSLPTNTTIDLEQNTKAITIQMLCAIFTFSSYFRAIALERLASYCVQERLSNTELMSFQQIAAYNTTTIKKLTLPYVDYLIHTWTEKQLPIAKFPFILCGNTLKEFVQQNLSKIVISCLLHGKSNALEELTSFNTKTELLKLSLPIAHALILPYKAECEEANGFGYKRYIETLADNFKSFDIDLFNCHGKDAFSCETLYNLFILVQDELHFQDAVNYPLFYNSMQWFNLSANSLRLCVEFYVIGNTAKEKDFFTALLSKGSGMLVRALGALKRNVITCLNPIDALKHFTIFYTVIDVLIDFIPDNSKTKDALQNCAKFIVRDALCFILQILRNVTEYNMQNTGVIFLQHFMAKPVILSGFCQCVVLTHLNDIFKSLIYVAENAAMPNIEETVLTFMSSLLAAPDNEMLKAIALLDEFPMSQRFVALRQTQCDIQSSDGEKDMTGVVTSFLHLNNRGIEGVKAMRHYLADNKDEMQYYSDLMYELIKRLIDVVRTSKNAEFCLEAVKCLGEIGSLKIESTSYYFKTDVNFYEDAAIELDAVSYLLQCALVALEKSAITFKTDSYVAAYAVAEYVVNTEEGTNILPTFPYFSIFKEPGRKKRKFNGISDDINWLDALHRAENCATFDEWICKFMYNILVDSDCGLWQTLQQLAAVESAFAKALLLPYVKLLMQSKATHLPNLLVMLEAFFAKFVENQASTTSSRDCIYKDKRVISLILNVCECVRIHNDWQVSINLMHVVRACNYCQAYFMAIMYLELWAVKEHVRDKELSNAKLRGNVEFQDCGVLAYRSVGYSDAIVGFLDPQRSRLQFLELDNNWSDILVEADTDDMLSDELYVDIMKRNGMLSLLDISKGSKIDFEVCWRLAKWDVPVDGHGKIDTLNDMELEYEKHHYNALKCLYNREENNSLAALANARQCVLVILKEISVECLQSVYKYLTWLQMLQQVEDFCQIQFGTQATSVATTATTATTTVAAQIFKKWQTETILPYGSFRCKELILSHQITLLQTAGVRANRKINALYQNNPITLCSLKCIRACKAAGEMNLAKRNMARLRKMSIESVHVKVNVLLEDADLCFKSGHTQITRAILQNMLRTTQMQACPDYLAAYRMYGEYLLETNMENFETVLRKYLNPSIARLSQYEKVAVTADAFRLETFAEFKQKMNKNVSEIIAKYADREYTQLDTFVKSEGFQMKRQIIAQNRNAANAVKLISQARDDKLCGAMQMKRFANLDEKEIEFNEKKCSENLCIAIEHYLKLCRIDEGASTAAIYRVIALWFANRSNDDLHRKMKEFIAEVPSFKFICALNQMTAQLNASNEAFLEVLQLLLIRCAQDHPHHTLYHLYSLVFAFNDNISTSATSSTSHNSKYNRVHIAKAIIKQASSNIKSECIQQMELMLPALISFANVDAQKTNNNLSDTLRRMKCLNAVQCPTIPLPVSANKNYNITSISKWDEKITLVGGLNAPKKLICLCSDGRWRPQLLKGRDDMRQDAVMQQVFTSINEMLANEPAAVERKLLLRTYKVVPLSMRSGILEWCENALPIGVYLCGSGKGKGSIGAHQRYYPQEMEPQKCRLMANQHLKSELTKRHSVHQYLCAQLTPVFHYFLLEKFLVPGIWFERRLAYTNSVATTSMVGYILGLGDRHAQNILIDEQTAEVIHIDFGIAFEQGKIMPTPETVPFRLTRDMVAPMGVCETNGVFKKSCETTMQVLRRNQAVIMTILEVLLHDPLYMWNVVPQLSAVSAEQGNTMAQRALLNVQNKLEGKQAGVLGNSDVPAQVQRLINEAVATINLCQLYPGWDPYL